MNKFLPLLTFLILIVSSNSLHAAKKETKQTKKAKIECLKENPELKGKQLQQCIKSKTKK